MGYADDPEPIDWRKIAIVGIAILALCLVGGIIYGVIYYEHLPTGAQKAAQDAAARFDFLEDQRASDDDLCAAAGAAKSAYANIQDAADYQQWASRERTACLNAELKRRLAEPSY
jgi:hypothetical protein